MAEFFMSLARESAKENQSVETNALFGALWPLEGRVMINDAVPEAGATPLLQGRSEIRARGSDARWLRFALTEKHIDGDDVLHCAPIALDSDLTLLRLDTVTFPPGAVAWRHVHPGPGVRHLLNGQLTLSANDHDKPMHAGDTWFEPANTPVQATASGREAKTGFVRFMALPPQHLGEPTIQFMDPADNDKPRLQVTRRHLDTIVRLS